MSCINYINNTNNIYKRIKKYLLLHNKKSTVLMIINTVLSAFVELYILFGVQFDDKCFVNFDRKFFTLRKTSECSFEAF